MYEYKMIRHTIVDGDTVHATLDLGFGIEYNTTLRLLGIDTPEVRTKDIKEKALGLKAKSYLDKLCSEPDVIVLTEKSGKYGSQKDATKNKTWKSYVEKIKGLF